MIMEIWEQFPLSDAEKKQPSYLFESACRQYIQNNEEKITQLCKAMLGYKNNFVYNAKFFLYGAKTGTELATFDKNNVKLGTAAMGFRAFILKNKDNVNKEVAHINCYKTIFKYLKDNNQDKNKDGLGSINVVKILDELIKSAEQIMNNDAYKEFATTEWANIAKNVGRSEDLVSIVTM